MRPAETQPGDSDALFELRDTLIAAACGEPISRIYAVRYTECRDLLVSSPLRDRLPGYLTTCVTLFRFRDFIRLYHEDEEARVAFIKTSLQPCLPAQRTGSPFDVFEDYEF
ncbi:MAG: hypothetical protein ACFBQW_00870 [Sphingomonadaceae bacterium]